MGPSTRKLSSIYSGRALARSASSSKLTSPRFPRPGDSRRPPCLFVLHRRGGEGHRDRKLRRRRRPPGPPRPGFALPFSLLSCLVNPTGVPNPFSLSPRGVERMSTCVGQRVNSPRGRCRRGRARVVLIRVCEQVCEIRCWERFSAPPFDPCDLRTPGKGSKRVGLGQWIGSGGAMGARTAARLL